MMTKPPPTTPAAEADAESRLQEALARMKAASDRHAAIVAVTSRLGASAQERRFAQSEGKKVDRELSEAKRLLREAQAATLAFRVRPSH
jgi:hypothetical protein